MIYLFAPHADDEIIGCWNLIRGPKNVEVLFFAPMEKERMAEALLSSQRFGYTPHFETPLTSAGEVVSQRTKPIIIGPDPQWELHPYHKAVGNLALEMARRNSGRFIAYTTNMNAPYMTELTPEGAEQKKKDLDEIYPSQSDLWKYDHKYFLFEGLCEWNPSV